MQQRLKYTYLGIILVLGSVTGQDILKNDTVEDDTNTLVVDINDIDKEYGINETEYFKQDYVLEEDIDSNDTTANVTTLKHKSLVDEACANRSLTGHQNTTKHRGIVHGFSESITVILVSEIGDKTFFIAAILAMRNNKLTVFLAAVSALFLMTVLSGMLGWVVTTFIPREYTYYTCTAIMFAFGLKMLWEAWRMDDNEAEETQKEVEQELAEMDGMPPRSSNQTVEVEQGQAGVADNAALEAGQANLGFEPDRREEGVEQGDKKPGTLRGVATRSGEGWLDGVIDSSCRENSWFGKKCLKIFKLFVNCFSMTFIAEWGDRSQLATIVLAGLNDVWGVILGGCLGHAICTGGAVLVGTIIAKFISPRKITFIGALVFIGFAIASIFTDPNEDGIDGIPDIVGYDNCTRMLNHNISQTLELEEMEMEMMEY